MSEWKKKGKKELERIREMCEGIVEDAPIPADQKEEVVDACVIDSIKLWSGKDLPPTQAVPKSPQQEDPEFAQRKVECEREALKATDPKLKEEFINWCLTDTPSKRAPYIIANVNTTAISEGATFGLDLTRKEILRSLMMENSFRRAVSGRSGFLNDLNLRYALVRDLILTHRFTDEEVADKMEMTMEKVKHLREDSGVPPVIKSSRQPVGQGMTSTEAIGESTFQTAFQAPENKAEYEYFECSYCKRKCQLCSRGTEVPQGCLYTDEFLSMDWVARSSKFSTSQKEDWSLFVCDYCLRQCNALIKDPTRPLSCLFLDELLPIPWHLPEIVVTGVLHEEVPLVVICVKRFGSSWDQINESYPSYYLCCEVRKLGG